MTTISPREEATVAAICAALAPYPWRSFTPEMLTRAVLAASDRQGIRELLSSVPGVAVGPWEEVSFSDRGDVRVKDLVEFLMSHRWSDLSLSGLCRELLARLDVGAGGGPGDPVPES